MPMACDDYVEQYNPDKGGEEEAPAVVTVEKSFTATVDVPMVKTTITDGENNTKVVSWEGGDEIAVYWGAEAKDFGTAVTKQGGASATFTGSVAEVDNYAAVYPSTVAASLVEASKVNVTIPAAQDGSFVAANVMAAVTGKDQMAFSFENVGAYIKFTVEQENVGQVVFAAKESLGGTVEMAFASAGVTATVTGGAKSVAFPTATVGSAVAPGDYYVCVAPTVLSEGLTVTAVKTDGSVLAMNTIETIPALERSYLYEIGAVDYIDPSTISEYFVTVEGKGGKTGLDWDNAMSAAELRELLTANEETAMKRGKALDGKTVHLAAGNYVMADPELKYCPVNYAGYAVPVSVVFLGGYDNANLANRTPETTPTVFSGNKENAGFVIGENVNFTFDGVTFADAKAIDDADLITKTRGAVFVDASTATLTFNNCTFKDNQERTAQSSGSHGGSALLLKKGHVYINGCLFTGNVSGSRGGVIRTDSNEGVLYMNNCVFSGNSIWKDSYGMCMFTKGNLGMNKCLFIGNTAEDKTKNIPSLNLNWNYVMINCTVLEDSYFSTGTGALRTETKTSDKYKAAIMNNIIASIHPEDENNQAYGILASQTGLVSKGYNIICGKDGAIKNTDKLPVVSTDLALTSLPATYTFDPATYQLTWDSLGFNFADNAAVEEMLRSADMVAEKGVATFAADFADWLKSLGAL